MSSKVICTLNIESNTCPHYSWKVLEYCNSVGEIYDVVVEDMIRQSAGLQG